jgi:hypothetical protein
VPALGQHEGLSREVGEGHVGRQPQRARVALEAYVVRALLALGRALRPAQDRLAAHGDARAALQRLEHAQEQRRPERALVLQEARGEIEHAEGAVRPAEGGLEHVGVLAVALLAARAVGPADAEAAAALLVQQAREERLGVEARQAAPHDLAARVDQRRELAVADQAELLEAHGGRTRRRQRRLAVFLCGSNDFMLGWAACRAPPASPCSWSWAWPA